MKKITIIIPNYNGLKFLPACLKALSRQTFQDFDILVVDNGSEDGSVQWLKEQQVPSIFLPGNLGFSGAVNVGIRAPEEPLANQVGLNRRVLKQLVDLDRVVNQKVARDKSIYS